MPSRPITWIVDLIPQHNQSLESLLTQLEWVRQAAVRLGMYDAADFVLQSSDWMRRSGDRRPSLPPEKK